MFSAVIPLKLALLVALGQGIPIDLPNVLNHLGSNRKHKVFLKPDDGSLGMVR